MRRLIQSVAGLAACLAFAGTTAAATTTPWLTGAVVTPRNFPDHGAAELTDMFRLDAELGSLAVIRIDWKDSNRLEAVRALMALAAQRNLKAVVELNPLKADGIKGAEIDPPKEASARRMSFANPEVSGPFERAALELAELKPAFLAVATDVNLLALSSPGEYAAFTALYRRLYEKIKRTSPGTKVFVTFQWEAMQGQGERENRRQVDAVRSHMDLLAFTSDPRKLHESHGPSGIPGDYYERMARYRATREELLVEVTWPTDGSTGEADQLAFVRDLPRLMGGLKPSMLVWNFLHDVKVLIFTFRSGLLDADGRPKPAFSAFRDLGGTVPAPVAAAAASSAASSAPRSRLAKANREPAHFGIYTARLDGSEMTPVMTSDDQEMTHPRVSPDGTRIVLTRYNRKGKDGKATEEKGYEDTEIMVVNLDGTGLETIVPGKPGVIAANGLWSPDGKSLIYLSTDNAERDPTIREIDVATRRITRVPTPRGLKTTDPHWLGNQMVFPVKGKDVDALWVMNADGSHARQVTNPPEKRSLFSPGLYGDFDPKLSPDGSKVAFMRIAGGTSWRVVVLDLKTGEERLLTPSGLTKKGVMQWLPTWSGDGKLLLYMHVDLKNLGETGLYTMTPDGRNRKRVPLPRGYMFGHATFFPGEGSSPAARIIFTATRNPAF